MNASLLFLTTRHSHISLGIAVLNESRMRPSSKSDDSSSMKKTILHVTGELEIGAHRHLAARIISLISFSFVFSHFFNTAKRRFAVELVPPWPKKQCRVSRPTAMDRTKSRHPFAI